MTRILGIDPGSAQTGLCVVERGNVLAVEVLERPKAISIDSWCAFVCRNLDDFVRGVNLVAIEDINAPNPHMGMTNPRPHMETSRLIGSIVTYIDNRFVCDVVMVPPGGHGSNPLATYPTELVGPNEPKGTGRLRHARSAWDVAMAAPTYFAFQQANEGAKQ